MFEIKTIITAIAAAIVLGIIIGCITGCQVLYPTRDGYAAAAILTNSDRISVSKDGAEVVNGNVSNPVGTGFSGLAPLVLAPGL